MKKLWNKIPPFCRNKYFITLFLFLLWMIFFDQHNMISQARMSEKVSDLQKEQEYYRQEIKKDRQAAMELQTNAQTLEKYARETYLMKRENEDIFLIVEDTHEAANE